MSVKSNQKEVVVPASVTVPAGIYTITFPITTAKVTTTVTSTITATLGTSHFARSITVTPTGTVANPTITGMTFPVTTLVGGTGTTATVTLSAPPSASLTMSVKSNQKEVIVPASVTVPAGANTVTFPITTAKVTTNVTATITATLGTSHFGRSITVTPN